MRPFVEGFPDGTGRGTNAIPLNDNNCALVLTANVPQRIAIPANSKFAVVLVSSIQGQAQAAWVNFGNSAVNAAIPNNNIVDGSASIIALYNIYKLDGVATHVSCISPVNAIVSISFYA
jgi:hypothetical protein